jgi:hypothetical protein
MKKLSILLAIISIAIGTYALNPPIKITWENLRDVTFKKKWNAEEKMFILEPQFGPKVTAQRQRNKFNGLYDTRRC